jgi:hypothetical protein
MVLGPMACRRVATGVEELNLTKDEIRMDEVNSK